jgi:two-component system C4-dicarboxylate transport sensor histidine kinase DctB
VGEIAAEVAHELRNVLQVIATTAFVARKALDQGDAPAARPEVAKIERSARLGHTIVDGLMALARGETLQREPSLLTEVLAAARTDIGQNALFVDQIRPPDLEVRVHAVLFARLLHALFENAVEASRPRVPTVTTLAHRDGGRVIVQVTDDGPGVPVEISSRAFDPLVSASPGGTGLGLALAHRIARAHEGSIALVDSKGGASFRIELPAGG